MFTRANRCSLHERAVAARMLRRDAEELVQVEGRRLREIDLPVRVQRAELVIQPDRRPPRRQPEHQRRASPATRSAMRARAPGERPIAWESGDRESSSGSCISRSCSGNRGAAARFRSARRTAPPAGSTSSSRIVRLRGDASGSRRVSSSSSHGTARKIPPDRTNGNSAPTSLEPPGDRQRRTTRAGRAALRRMPIATASPSANASWTHCASAPIADGLQVAVIDLVNQILRAARRRSTSAAAASAASSGRADPPRAATARSAAGRSSSRCPRRRARSPSRRRARPRPCALRP